MDYFIIGVLAKGREKMTLFSPTVPFLTVIRFSSIRVKKMD